MQVMSISHLAEHQKLNKPWSEIFALGNAFFNQSDGSLHIPSSNSVRNTIDTAASIPTVSPLTTNKLNRTIVTVTDVWREFDYNIYLIRIAIINTVFSIGRFRSLQVCYKYYYYSTEDYLTLSKFNFHNIQIYSYYIQTLFSFHPQFYLLYLNLKCK